MSETTKANVDIGIDVAKMVAYLLAKYGETISIRDLKEAGLDTVNMIGDQANPPLRLTPAQAEECRSQLLARTDHEKVAVGYFVETLASVLKGVQSDGEETESGRPEQAGQIRQGQAGQRW